MKKILKHLLLLLIAFSCLNSRAQSSGTDSLPTKREIYIIVEEMPSFPGGEENLYKYLANNIRYPVYERDNGLSGKVYISFVVEPDGSISNIAMLKEIPGAPGFTKEAIRLISEMPKWEPGKQKGIAVPVHFNLPITWSKTNIPQWHIVMKEGSLLLNKKKYESAIVKFNEALEISPNKPEILFERATAKLNSGDKGGACNDWTTIVQSTKVESIVKEASGFLAAYCKE